ncbi:MAG: hypothetical protein E6Z15_11395, partial [Paenibacillus macerans]|nr:hypothetical protein [Paenibacillus macerans]
MNKRYPSLVLLVLCIFAFLLPAASWAETLTEEEQQILEQSLSIKEIDREIARIEARQQETETAIRKLSGQLAAKNEQIRVSREQAGARIRAYYMG